MIHIKKTKPLVNKLNKKSFKSQNLNLLNTKLRIRTTFTKVPIEKDI